MPPFRESPFRRDPYEDVTRDLVDRRLVARIGRPRMSDGAIVGTILGVLAIASCVLVPDFEDPARLWGAAFVAVAIPCGVWVARRSNYLRAVEPPPFVRDAPMRITGTFATFMAAHAPAVDIFFFVDIDPHRFAAALANLDLDIQIVALSNLHAHTRLAFRAAGEPFDPRRRERLAAFFAFAAALHAHRPIECIELGALQQGVTPRWAAGS